MVQNGRALTHIHLADAVHEIRIVYDAGDRVVRERQCFVRIDVSGEIQIVGRAEKSRSDPAITGPGHSLRTTWSICSGQSRYLNTV